MTGKQPTRARGQWLMSKAQREYLISAVRARPERFRSEVARHGGTPRQKERRKFIRRCLRRFHPGLLETWFGPAGQTAPVTTRPMTDEERARYFPEGKW
jgi:hypothetical protein